MRCRVVVLCLLALPLLVAAGSTFKFCSGAGNQGLNGWDIYGEPFKSFRQPDRRAKSNGANCRKACLKDSKCFGWQIEGHPRTPTVCNFFTGGANSEYYVGNTVNTYLLTGVCLIAPTSQG